MFSCEFSEICKNTLSGRTPPVAASVGNGLIFVLGFYCRANELSNDSQIALIINVSMYQQLSMIIKKHKWLSL